MELHLDPQLPGLCSSCLFMVPSTTEELDSELKVDNVINCAQRGTMFSGRF